MTLFIIKLFSLTSSPNSNIAINVAIKQQIAQTHTNALARNGYYSVYRSSNINTKNFTGFHIFLAFSVNLDLYRVGERVKLWEEK